MKQLIWDVIFSLSNVVAFATIETKSIKRKKKKKKKFITHNQECKKKKKKRIFEFLFYQNDICIIVVMKNAYLYDYINHGTCNFQIYKHI